MLSSHRLSLLVTAGAALCLAPHAVHCQAATEAPAWPTISAEARPWTRWWWHGSAVAPDELTDALVSYRDIGLGGVEITPIYGVAGKESSFIDFLSPLWMDRLGHTLREAERLGLGVDIATGTGWPFGGPHVADEHAPRYIAHRLYTVSGGERLTESVSYTQEPLVRAVGNQIYEMYGIYRLPGEAVLGDRQRPAERPASRRIGIDDLIEPVSANRDLQGLALEQVRFPKSLPLEALMAYSNAGAVLDLTGLVEADGNLDWVAPAGEWTLYALFQGWHGKLVERAAPGGEGNVIDHFSSDALQAYLAPFDEAFAGHPEIASIRAFFNDSYEVDDATGQGNWTPALFAEFETRRGYDLRQHLPALFGDDSEEQNARVLSDYRETISDLLLDRFTREWSHWARSKEAIVRNQAHGSPANILDLYAASDIPETEGTSILRFKFATSAAHVTGKSLASSESATWLGEHFTSSLADVRRVLDSLLLGGVNHIFYHGTAYSPEAEPWPGWLFYAAVHFTPANPWWTDFSALNQYVARAQSFLQSGRPNNDVLLYYPVYDRFASPGDNLLEHFDGNPGSDESSFRIGAETLLDRGYGFDYISDRQLQNVQLVEGSLETGGNRYQVVVLPEARFVPLATVEKLVDLASGGATIVSHGGLPSSVPGLGDLPERGAALERLMGQLRFEPSGDSGIQEAVIGSGRWLQGDDLDQLLRRAEVRRETLVDAGLDFVRRQDGEGTTYFLTNTSELPFNGWISIGVGAASAALYDPMSGQTGYTRLRAAGPARAEIYLQIPAGESRIVRMLNTSVDGGPSSYFRESGEPREIRGTWTITFEEGGPETPPTLRTQDLASWTDLGDDGHRSFSGTALYEIDFARPSASGAEGWLLDLGRLHESARVRLNGKDLGTLVGPNFRIRIESDMLREENRLEVRVTNLMANRIADLDRRGTFWKKFYNVNFPSRLAQNRGANGLFDASQWSPLPSGLVGPVTLIPLESFQP